MKNTVTKPLTLNDYAKLIGYPNKVKESNFDALQDIQDFANDEFDVSLWDYPLSELDYVNENEIVFAYVLIGDEVRLCEIEN